jgi:18S rRNA (guanine1575-N7)-methyltransferase
VSTKFLKFTHKENKTMSTKRPELLAPPELFYDTNQARKYAQNTRILEIQTKMSERAVELLAIPEDNTTPYLILDIGCGSGISGQVLTERGHMWMGVDISRPMLDVARQNEVEGDLFQSDMGQGMFFRVGTFDAAISISAIQWLCNADKKEHVPQRRLMRFFSTLYRTLRKGARAVFQFYPENAEQMDLITQCAMKAGFSGGMLVDYPNSTRAKKYFLVLFAGIPERVASQQMPKALEGEEEEQQQNQVKNIGKRKNHEKKKCGTGNRPMIKSREWIIQKKEQQRARGEQVRPHSKYTGRKRKPKF